METTGRVAALLELGAGFNPEFTGRENVYLNGSVLGLSRKDIDERFDAIAGFADIGAFIEQPVKTYSSGMFVRLAFAVAVNVDADILIVDEALSVGDMYFQAKCMAHMKNLINSGVTVLFVSHDVNAVKSLCGRAVYLDEGKVAAAGSTEDVVEVYFGAGVIISQSASIATNLTESAIEFDEAELAEHKVFSRRASFHRLQNGKAEFLDVHLVDESGDRVTSACFGQSLILRMVFRANCEIPIIGLAYHLRDRNGFDVIYSDTGIEHSHVKNVRLGEIVRIDWEFKIRLREGDYAVAAMLSIPEDLSIGKVDVCDFVPIAANVQVGRGTSLPLHGAVYWENKVTQQRCCV